jgi:hypothetical protein
LYRLTLKPDIRCLGYYFTGINGPDKALGYVPETRVLPTRGPFVVIKSTGEKRPKLSGKVGRNTLRLGVSRAKIYKPVLKYCIDHRLQSRIEPPIEVYFIFEIT